MADPYKEAELHRNAFTDAVVQSGARRIVVVAGPGTGKTTLFAKLLTKRGTDNLTLSFINSLVDDLALSLGSISKVDTLHGFSIGQLKAAYPHGRIFSGYEDVAQEDAAILLNKDVPFKSLFNTGAGPGDLFEFYEKRKKYYGEYFGFADAVYYTVEHLRANEDKTPEFSQIVVDEFQDFNESEVALIELLAKKSPILIAGDDDQSLYMALKSASPAHIRKRHSDAGLDYKTFPLPYCSRSTRVIVDAVNDVVKEAAARGLLRDRVAKEYVYFPCAMKDRESAQSPKVIYRQMFDGMMPYFIQKELEAIAKDEKNPFSVLVVAHPLKATLRRMAKAFRKRGFRNVKLALSDDRAALLDGLRMLVRDKSDNLGWRIAAKALLSPVEFAEVLKASENGKPMSKLVGDATREAVDEMVGTLKKIKLGKDTEPEALQRLMERLGHLPYKEPTAILEDLLLEDEARQRCARAIRNIPITLTTISGSKGLADDYVFLVHFDEAHFATNGQVTDADVFNFLVAITRARKRAYLYSRGDAPTILSFVHRARVDR